MHYEDSTGAIGLLPAGGVEWFKAAHGAWHSASPADTHTRGFQLWIALPPEEELGPVENIYQNPDDIKSVGPARILLGTYNHVTSPIKTPTSVNYLAVLLKAGETWRYNPPDTHTVGWIALLSGRVQTPEKVEAGELAIFEPSNREIAFYAEEDTEFVLGSAVPYPHKLIISKSSVHTSPAALQAAEKRIEDIKNLLQKQGHLPSDM
jgi:redox-sensitive bicupin YhaK (pirin superfamily)